MHFGWIVALFNCFYKFTSFKRWHAFDLPDSAENSLLLYKRIDYIIQTQEHDSVFSYKVLIKTFVGVFSI